MSKFQPGQSGNPATQFKSGESGSPATRFQPGESGNPAGLPKGIAEVRELARTYTKPAIEKLARLMESGYSEQVQLMAANALLDRGWGKPMQPFAGEDIAPPVRIDVRLELLRVLNQLADARDQEPGRRFGALGLRFAELR